MFHVASLLLVVIVCFVASTNKKERVAQQPQEDIDVAYFDKEHTLWVKVKQKNGIIVHKKAYGDQKPVQSFKDINGFLPPQA